MTGTTQEDLREALQLDAEARADIAAELLASLDGPEDEDVEAAWSEEIARRVAAFRSGAVKTDEWSEVQRRIERDALRR